MSEEKKPTAADRILKAAKEIRKKEKGWQYRNGGWKDKFIYDVF